MTVVRPTWTTGPATLTLVRHAHSVGNRADALAREEGAERLALPMRDADVGLSETGHLQAVAVGEWLADQGGRDLPTVVLSSPFLRAIETAEQAVTGLGIDVVLDERLRERDVGQFDGLTLVGIRSRHPEEVERRRKVGSFYYQPPSGESWCDLALRVRSLLQDLRFGYDDARVWIFTHQAVVLTFRYVLEGMPEERLIEIDTNEHLPNASITSYRRAGHLFELERYADTRAVDSAGEASNEASHGPGDARNGT